MWHRRLTGNLAVPINPNNKVFIHTGKKTHVILQMVWCNPGRWGIMTVARIMEWDHNDTKKVVNKLVRKGLILISNPSRKLYPTENGRFVLSETNLRSST